MTEAHVIANTFPIIRFFGFVVVINNSIVRLSFSLATAVATIEPNIKITEYNVITYINASRYCVDVSRPSTSSSALISTLVMD